jgi:hypothetical protein
MKGSGSRRGLKGVVATAIVTAAAAMLFIQGTAVTAGGGHRSEHWGVITRNTIGSPVADLRTGPFGSIGVVGPSARPPFGKGSLGIYVNDPTGFVEKVDFGNEIDFFGDAVSRLEKVGFHVFQTGENAAISPSNMPNIRLEINPDLVCVPLNYTTMVWLPDPAPVVNQWTEFLDATTTGQWFFTGTAGTCTNCNLTTTCTFDTAKAALGVNAIIYSVAVGKGRDRKWAGAVDGLRINDDIYDFEDEPHGVLQRSLRGGKGKGKKK